MYIFSNTNINKHSNIASHFHIVWLNRKQMNYQIYSILTLECCKSCRTSKNLIFPLEIIRVNNVLVTLYKY